MKTYVYAHWHPMSTPIKMGVLSAEYVRGSEIFSFEYDEQWLKSAYAQQLDPDLSLYTGRQFLSDESKQNFGIFLDSSPDRWGRVLMKRREAALARTEGRRSKVLVEMDYLLGVFDGHRMGGMRFKREEDGPFLNDNKKFASPPWTSLHELEQISLKLEEDSALDDPDYIKWLNMIIAPGSSLGGARPKASVVHENGALWIAKFPSRLDGSDIGGWELVTYRLATQFGINMSECIGRKFSSDYHTFLTKRFDRTNKGERIHFASAMTLLGKYDGQGHDDGSSYLELAEFIMSNGANVRDDLRELWRRIVFSIAVSNTDDHFRNHGFILTNKGWVLSPAYDINPNETGQGLKLNINDAENALDYGLAIEVSTIFEYGLEEAKQEIQRCRDIVGSWSKLASEISIPRIEQELKETAFNV